MLWISYVLVVAASFAIRGYVNRGQTRGTPDEKRYSQYAYTWRPGKAYGEAVDAFLALPKLEIPPTRYGFFAVAALVNRRRKEWTQCFQPMTWIAAAAGAVAAPVAFQITHSLSASLLVASSPLSLFLSRRALQDTFTTLLLLVGLWGTYLQNPWLLGTAVALALASREAVLFYLPALGTAWAMRTGHWVEGVVILILSGVAAVAGYYAIGGRKLLEVFRKLKQPTDYIRRFQAGMPHRVLVDLILVSPVPTVAALMSWTLAPTWLLAFVGTALVTHALINPKNVRFLLVVDLTIRMLCCWLPGPWPWVVLGVGLAADLWLYRAFATVEDPVTSNLVMKMGMYQE